jgi:hypothetical protein
VSQDGNVHAAFPSFNQGVDAIVNRNDAGIVLDASMHKPPDELGISEYIADFSLQDEIYLTGFDEIQGLDDRIAIGQPAARVLTEPDDFAGSTVAFLQPSFAFILLRPDRQNVLLIGRNPSRKNYDEDAILAARDQRFLENHISLLSESVGRS